MLRANDFWDKEKGAPLLRRNAEFLPKGEPLPAELADRVAAWPGLCGADAEARPRLPRAERANARAKRALSARGPSAAGGPAA